MVNKIFGLINKEIHGLHQAAFLLGSFALLSQILALVRDKLLAHTFGAGISLDIYYASFRIPDFLFVTIGSLVSMSVIIPFLIDAEGKGRVETQKFLNSVFTFFVLFISTVSLVVFFLLPYLLPRFFPGFTGAETKLLIITTRILLLSPILLGISNLFGSLTQSHNRFFVYAMSPLLYNVGIISGILFLYPYFGIVGLVWGVIIGAILHLLIQLPSVQSVSLLPKLTLSPDWKSIKKLATLSFPRTLTLSVSHIAVFFLLSFASLMAIGSISVFNLAFNLQSVPLSIIGVSYSLAAFPTLSRYYTGGEKENFIKQFITSAQHIVFWSVPCAVLFIVLRAHIVRVILGSGHFDWTDTRLTAAVLALFCVSLVFQALVLLFVRGLYAMGSTGKPLYVNLISGVVIVASSFFFYRAFELFPTFRYFFESLFKVPEIAGASVLMLALGFTVGSVLDGVLMWILFVRQVKGITAPIIRTFFETFSGAVIMGFTIYLTLRVFDNLFTLETFSGVFFQGFLSAICGIFAWITVLRLLKSKELEQIQKTVHARFWKAKVVSPDSQVV